MISIIIPARTEKFLNKTIKNVISAATGEIEILVVLDGYDNTPYVRIDNKCVKYISLPLPDNYERHKRQAVNAAISISNGKYIMWMDAHCAIAEGFDEVLVRDCEDNWVVVPSRCWLDLKKWDRKYLGLLPMDHRYFMLQGLLRGSLSTHEWDKRSIERKNITIDDIFVAQGSLFFMTRKHFDRMGFMKIEGYMGWGQEGEEICLTTLLKGGRVIVNKNTWYAHASKKQMGARMYPYVDAQPSYDYSFNYWVHEHSDFFVELMNKHMPIPNFKSDWEKRLYG